MTVTEVAIVLPGIMGSVLKDGTDVVWPGPVTQLFLPYQKMPQLLQEKLDATDIIRSVSLSTQYKALIDALAACGFHESVVPQTLFVCPYDWRKDNALAAPKLASVVAEATKAHGSDIEITFIAHSMGGLVARYYLESGEFDDELGFGNIKRLITLATPHRGAPLALQAALGQIRRLFLDEKQVSTLANDKRFPSVYQLLPPRGVPFAWDEDAKSRFGEVDVYQPSVSSALGLSQENIGAAVQFHAKLNLGRRPDHVRYFFFAGTRQKTVSEVRIRLSQIGSRVRAEQREDAGDGTVPLWSGCQSGVQMAPVGGEHGDIYKDGKLQQILAVLLGKAGALAAALPRMELSLRDPVLIPAEQTRAVLDFRQVANQLDGRVNIVRIVDGKGNLLPSPVISATQPVKYTGIGIDRLSLEVTAPDFTGLYRVQFINAQNNSIEAEDDLIVQAP